VVKMNEVEWEIGEISATSIREQMKKDGKF